MQSYKSESIRNVALLSHSKAGKTSLSEAILFNAGHTTRLGRVEDGNTTSDYEPEEVNRGGSIQLTLLPYEWNDTKVNLIDTPGYADFFGEVVAALKVADSALLVVCAASGIEVGTELMWGEISARELPAMILLNKMDRENADFAAVLEKIQGPVRPEVRGHSATNRCRVRVQRRDRPHNHEGQGARRPGHRNPRRLGRPGRGPPGRHGRGRSRGR